MINAQIKARLVKFLEKNQLIYGEEIDIDLTRTQVKVSRDMIRNWKDKHPIFEKIDYIEVIHVNEVLASLVVTFTNNECLYVGENDIENYDLFRKINQVCIDETDLAFQEEVDLIKATGKLTNDEINITPSQVFVNLVHGDVDGCVAVVMNVKSTPISYEVLIRSHLKLVGQLMDIDDKRSVRLQFVQEESFNGFLMEHFFPYVKSLTELFYEAEATTSTLTEHYNRFNEMSSALLGERHQVYVEQLKDNVEVV